MTGAYTVTRAGPRPLTEVLALDRADPRLLQALAAYRQTTNDIDGHAAIFCDMLEEWFTPTLADVLELYALPPDAVAHWGSPSAGWAMATSDDGLRPILVAWLERTGHGALESVRAEPFVGLLTVSGEAFYGPSLLDTKGRSAKKRILQLFAGVRIKRSCRPLREVKLLRVADRDLLGFPVMFSHDYDPARPGDLHPIPDVMMIDGTTRIVFAKHRPVELRLDAAGTGLAEVTWHVAPEELIA